MKEFIVVIFLIFFLLPVQTRSEDLRDFEIKGISIEDSLLDYYSKVEIDKNIKNYGHKDNTFSTVEFQNIKSSTYDAIQFQFKTLDTQYIIQGVHGILDCRSDFTKCSKQFNKIEENITKFFGDDVIKSGKEVSKHKADKSGKSISTTVSFKFSNGDIAHVQMIDWSKEKGWWDHLRISVATKELSDWYNNKAY